MKLLVEEKEVSRLGHFEKEKVTGKGVDFTMLNFTERDLSSFVLLNFLKILVSSQVQICYLNASKRSRFVKKFMNVYLFYLFALGDI